LSRDWGEEKYCVGVFAGIDIGYDVGIGVHTVG
jgi:hypothetical protein